MKRYLPSIKQYSWILIVCTLFAAIAGFFVAKSLPPSLVVSSTILIETGAPGTSITSLTTSSDPTLSLAQANTYAAEITSREVMLYISNRYPEIYQKYGYSADDLLNDITATASTTSATISVTATTSSRGDSIVLANDVADGFVAYTQNKLQQELNTLINGLQTQVTNYQKQKSDLEATLLKIGNTSDPRYAIYSNDLQDVTHNLDSTQAQLQQLPTTVRSDASVIQHATAADVTSSSKTSLIVAATGGVGFLIGCLLMMLMIFLDDRLRGGDQVKEKLGLAYLGELSGDKGLGANSARAEGRSLQEISDIYANLHLTGVITGQWHAPKGGVLLVTSARTAEGKTTVATNLAVSVVRSGGTVVVVDANLRRPSTHLAFGMTPVGPGLSGLLKSPGNVDGAVQRSNTPGVWLLPAGASMNEPTLLLEQKLPAILAQLRMKTDMIIIDGPSLLSDADATLLAAMADSVILVVDVRHDKLPLLHRARELLASLAHTPAGIVLNQTPRRKRDRYFATAYPENARTNIEALSSVQTQPAQEMQPFFTNGKGHALTNGSKAEQVGAMAMNGVSSPTSIVGQNMPNCLSSSNQMYVPSPMPMPAPGASSQPQQYQPTIANIAPPQQPKRSFVSPPSQPGIGG